MLIEQILASKPSSPTEWMMMRNGEAPLTETEHIEIVEEAITQLDAQSKFILSAIYYEQVAYEELGQRLGVSKPHAWRLTRKAIAALTVLIETHPTIIARYKLYKTWNEACLSTVESFWRTKLEPSPATLAWARQQLLETFALKVDPSSATLSTLATEAVSHIKADGHWTAKELADFLASKQHDYGHQNINNFGMLGILIRVCDKIERLRNLQTADEPRFEAVMDTWCDILGYCVIGIMYLDNTFSLPLEVDVEDK